MCLKLYNYLLAKSNRRGNAMERVAGRIQMDQILQTRQKGHFRKEKTKKKGGKHKKEEEEERK